MNKIFAASYSTLCTTALSALLSEKYALHGVQCTLLVRGVGDTYRVNALEGLFILRIYRASHRTLPNIQAEVALLQALKENEISVSYPISDLADESIQCINAIEGMRYAVLFSYAPGEPARIPDEMQLNALGREMARFHQISSTLVLPGARWYFDMENTFFNPLEKIKPGFKNDPDNYAWLQNAARQLDSDLAAIDTSDFPKGYIHFDFLPKNMHFKDGQVTFFDFDFMGYGWLVYDIAIFWQFLAVELYTNRITQQVFTDSYATFLSAYQSVRTVTDQELALVPRLALGFWLFYMAFHTTHDQFISFTQPSQLKSFVGFLRHLEEKYWPLAS